MLSVSPSANLSSSSSAALLYAFVSLIRRTAELKTVSNAVLFASSALISKESEFFTSSEVIVGTRNAASKSISEISDINFSEKELTKNSSQKIVRDESKEVVC